MYILKIKDLLYNQGYSIQGAKILLENELDQQSTKSTDQFMNPKIRDKFITINNLLSKVSAELQRLKIKP